MVSFYVSTVRLCMGYYIYEKQIHLICENKIFARIHVVWERKQIKKKYVFLGLFSYYHLDALLDN